MALRQSTQAANNAPVLSADGANDLVPIVATYTVPAGLALNDVIELGCLQAGYVPVDLIVALPQIDSNGSPTVTLNAGILSGNWQDTGTRTCGNEFFAADTTARAGGVARMQKAAGAQIAPTTNDRSWGLKVQAAIATLATGGVITATLLVRPRIENV